MIKVIHCTVNGKVREIAVDERESLTDMLRLRLGLTSVKKGCEAGECGACTVLIDGVAKNSCILLAMRSSPSRASAAKTGCCIRFSRRLWTKRQSSAASAPPGWC